MSFRQLLVDSPVAIEWFGFDDSDPELDTHHGSHAPTTVASTAKSDTNVTVELEDTNGSDRTSATVTTGSSDGTSLVSTASGTTFASLGSVWVDAEHTGSILVYDDNGSGNAGQLLAIIKGAERYDSIDYDRGVPPLGSGSFDDGSTLTDGKQYDIGAEVLWNDRPIADYHQGTSLTISNDIGEEAATDTGLAMARQVGTREITAETTAFGETASTDNFGDFVGSRGCVRDPAL